MKRCDDQRQASSEELNRKTEDTHSKVWEDMMKTSKECDESRWDRAIKLLSESLGAAQACRPVNGPRSEERRVGKECRSGWSPYH